MIKSLSKIILNNLMHWKVYGNLPNNDKYIIAVVPHSSYFDLIIAILIRSSLGLKIKFIGKKELFNPLTSFLFNYMGGIPVDRRGNKNFVESVTDLFNSNKLKILAIAPEGTRKKVNKWKTGFYYIALSAKIPIVMVSFDYQKKEVRINEKFYPTGDYESDIITLKGYVEDAVIRNK